MQATTEMSPIKREFNDLISRMNSEQLDAAILILEHIANGLSEQPKNN